MRKRLFMLAGCAFFAIPGFCEAEITAVNCTPRYPWNGKVDVDVTLANAEADAEYVVSLALVRADGSEEVAAALSGMGTSEWTVPNEDGFDKLLLTFLDGSGNPIGEPLESPWFEKYVPRRMLLMLR